LGIFASADAWDAKDPYFSLFLSHSVRIALLGDASDLLYATTKLQHDDTRDNRPKRIDGSPH